MILFAGGLESKLPESEEQLEPRCRPPTNVFVTTDRQSGVAIQTEYIQSAINFLDERIAVEQYVPMKALSGILQTISTTY